MQAARAYLAELEAGRAPDRQAYLLRHPELAGALADYFAGIELAHATAQALGPVPAPQPEFPASTLGDFHVLREVGRGGMGVVYEAVQLSLGRRVALKVLPFAAALDAKHLQRFKTEAQAAAQLHHTNIVPVHAVGCERGVHFYAMQLIDGQPLDAVIAELRGDPVPPVTALSGATDCRPGPIVARTSQRSGRDRESYRTAARIAVQVADALEYAHSAGVIHRDIKPANLLLDARGNVWVTDFGLAQVSADISLTRTGEVVGTLRYMSPEQAAGQRLLLDHRADVYSLGATLYELLTLAPIFPGQDRRALLNQILNEEPQPPRQVHRAIPVELETIVLKALAKAPAERYATAAEMAADLRRFLDERPILARRPSLVDRARKWARRHPSLVGSAFLLLLFAVVGLGVTTALVAREQARTQQAYDRERQRAEEAEERFRLAQQAADDLIQLANEELIDKPHLESLRKRLLEAALAAYQKLTEYRHEDPDAQEKLARTRDRVQQIIADLAALQGNGQFLLLMNTAVLDDLSASPEQREDIRKLAGRMAERWRASFRDFHKLPQEQRQQRLAEIARANEEDARAVMTAAQLGRLRQIAIQGRGLAAFQEPDIAAALKLESAQRERIRGIEADLFFGKAPPWLRPSSPPGKTSEQATKSALEKVLAVLTSEQRARWREITGEPFAGTLLHPPGEPGKGPPFPPRFGPFGPPK